MNKDLKKFTFSVAVEKPLDIAPEIHQSACFWFKFPHAVGQMVAAVEETVPGFTRFSAALFLDQEDLDFVFQKHCFGYIKDGMFQHVPSYKFPDTDPNCNQVQSTSD
jgi:hypothetical protein